MEEGEGGVTSKMGARHIYGLVQWRGGVSWLRDACRACLATRGSSPPLPLASSIHPYLSTRHHGNHHSIFLICYMITR